MIKADNDTRLPKNLGIGKTAAAWETVKGMVNPKNTGFGMNLT
jgi:hypothetical protein